MAKINHRRMFLCLACKTEPKLIEGMEIRNLKLEVVSAERVSLCRICDKKKLGTSIELRDKITREHLIAQLNS